MSKSELEIKYVLIEMIENDETKMAHASIIPGLFKGVRIYQPPKEDMLILVKSNKGETIHLLNTNKYNILSLQKFDGYTKIIHCFRATEEDQKLAIIAILEVIKELGDAGRTVENDDNIIDTSTYKNVPDDITIIKHSSAASINAHRNKAIHSQYKAPARQPNVVNTVVNKEPEPKYFKRNRKATEAALARMQKKIDDIKKGTYQVKLPVIKGDEVEKEAAKDDVTHDALGHDNNFYMHG